MRGRQPGSETSAFDPLQTCNFLVTVTYMAAVNHVSLDTFGSDLSRCSVALALRKPASESRLSPVERRRAKLADGIEEQGEVLAAKLRGEEFIVRKRRWAANETGEKVLIERPSRVRP